MLNITRLRSLIAEKNLYGIEQAIQHGVCWHKSYDEQNGLLYLLFPADVNDFSYNAGFSQACLTLMIKYGYEPSRDNDITNDFYTDCHRACFRDFCHVITNQSLTVQMSVFLALIERSVPFYHDHLEHLITPEMAQAIWNGTTALEQVWKKNHQ